MQAAVAITHRLALDVGPHGVQDLQRVRFGVHHGLPPLHELVQVQLLVVGLAVLRDCLAAGVCASCIASGSSKVGWLILVWWLWRRATGWGPVWRMWRRAIRPHAAAGKATGPRLLP